MAYEHPRSRRVHVMAVLADPGTAPQQPLTWCGRPSALGRAEICWVSCSTLPGDGERPRVVVLANASIHRATTLRDAREDLADQHRIHLCYLSPTASN